MSVRFVASSIVELPSKFLSHSLTTTSFVLPCESAITYTVSSLSVESPDSDELVRVLVEQQDKVKSQKVEIANLKKKGIGTYGE